MKLRYSELEKAVELGETMEVFEEQGSKDYKHKSGRFRSDKTAVKTQLGRVFVKKKIVIFARRG